ncbi:hypothetical protein TNIN_79121 [Trichonephila inaurata madagascariensis]|uniref:Uncharacterized protein n=1 Tax=Trichonephila inaurata madagascariensis TaxID=2747483 RepID=A0A8X7C1Y2_9ARAC|nr:hypothetical protein TNIN_79121 [Trichonephila inaurata madagascariensis]
MTSEDDHLNMETDSPDKSAFPRIRTPEDFDLYFKTIVENANRCSENYPDPSLRRTAQVSNNCHTLNDTENTPSSTPHARRATQDNDKRRRQKDTKKKATGPPDPPPKIPDREKCRLHKELQKDISMMCGRHMFLEHCIRSEKDFSDLTDDAPLAGYQKDYDDLVSLKENKLGELALILPCPVLDCPDSVVTPSNLSDSPKTNAKKHARNASQENKKSVKPPSNHNDGFTSPKKFAKKVKLIDPIAGPSPPITLENKFSSLAGEETKINDQDEQRFQLASTPKIPQSCSDIKKENYKALIKDLNKDFLNCNLLDFRRQYDCTHNGRDIDPLCVHWRGLSVLGDWRLGGRQQETSKRNWRRGGS